MGAASEGEGAVRAGAQALFARFTLLWSSVCRA